MCAAGGFPPRARGQGEGGGGGGGDDDGVPVPTEPTVTPLADGEESEAATGGSEGHDLHIGYLQISDEPARPSDDDPEEAEEGASTSEMNGSLTGAVVTNGRNSGERVVTVNGMQFHVYGNVGGLELLGGGPASREDALDIPEGEEEEDEARGRAAEERAIEEANQADAARRAAPISPEHRTRIVNAMRGVNLGGFRPSWADSVPEDQWISNIKERAAATSSASK